MTARGTQQPAPATASATVVFLDTNAVHYATLALAFGAKYHFDVLNQTAANTKAALQAKGITAWDRYVNGACIVRYLNQRFLNTSAEFYYSPITGLELLCGGLRGEAVKRAANIGVPHRWFSRMEEKEIRTCLESDGYDEVQHHHADIVTLFGDVGITLNEKAIDAEVWSLARSLLENIFVDVQDCLVYASAIVTQADELITADSYLQDTVRCTNNPGAAPAELTARFKSVKDAIVKSCVTKWGWEPNKVIVPVQVGLKDIRQHLSEGNP